MDDQFEYYVELSRYRNTKHPYPFSPERPYRIWRRCRSGWDREALNGGWEYFSPARGWEPLDYYDVDSYVYRQNVREVPGEVVADLLRAPYLLFKYWAYYTSKSSWRAGDAPQLVIREGLAGTQRLSGGGEWLSTWAVADYLEPRKDVNFHLVRISVEVAKSWVIEFTGDEGALLRGLRSDEIAAAQNGREQEYLYYVASVAYPEYPRIDSVGRDMLPISLYRRVGMKWEFLSLNDWTWRRCNAIPKIRPLHRVPADRAQKLEEERVEFVHYLGRFRAEEDYRNRVPPIELRRRRDSPDGVLVEKLVSRRFRAYWVPIASSSIDSIEDDGFVYLMPWRVELYLKSGAFKRMNLRPFFRASNLMDI